MTQNNIIFTGISTSTIKDGKLVSVSAEDEAIRIMSNSNENKISAMVVVNVHNLKPCTPCDSCKLLMLEINPSNLDCLIMQEDKSFIPLSELVDEVEQSIWDDGWGETDFGMDSISMNDSNIFNPNSNINRLQNISPKPTSIDFNPIPQRNSRYSTSSYGNSNSAYMETINGTSTLQTAVVEKSNSTFFRQANANQQNSRFKEMLKDIISDDTITNSNSPAPTLTTTPEPNLEPQEDINDNKYKVNVSQSLNVKAKSRPFKSTSKMLDETRKVPSKKELKLIAKEKKKQAKKNNKILESMEKHSRT
jgi:hypothetical protein